MTTDPNKSSLSQDKKINHQWHEDQHLQKTRRLLRSTSIIYPLLLALLLIVGTVFLVITVTRRNTCRHLREEERVGASLGVLPNEHTVTWVPCKKTNLSSTCACPVSFVHSKLNPSHCLPSHSHCLQSCKHNQHCACYNIADGHRCREVSSHWMKHEMKIESVEHVKHYHKENTFQHPWWTHSAQEIEHTIVNHKPRERLFFSADRQTAITIDIEQDDYLLNEHWTKISTNTTEQHVVYTQIDPQTHTCRMSSIYQNGTVQHGPDHACPGKTINAPYFLGVTCESVLVLWHGGMQSKTRRDEEWTISRHNFESFIPRLPILLDPFHRYYSLYDDLMIEVKDLNGEVLGQWFTDVRQPTKFEFIDQHGTIRIANRTHMQLITSTNENAWLDV